MGYMGSGKTTLGKQLANRLGFAFMDLDTEIEQNEQQSIAGIFKQKGEEYFRETERRTLQRIIGQKSKNIVLSLGGGTPCYADNISLINQHTVSVYIKLPARTLMQRLQQSKNKQQRPLLQEISDDALLNFVCEQLQQREPYYLQADYIFEPLTTTKKLWELPFLS